MKALLAFSSIFGISAPMLSQNLNIIQKNIQAKEISHHIGYSSSDKYSGTGKYSSREYMFFNWFDYGLSWKEFKQVYGKFKVSGTVYVAVKAEGDYQLDLGNAMYDTNAISEDKNKSLKITVPYFQKDAVEYCVFTLNIWKSTYKIYFDWVLYYKSGSYGPYSFLRMSVTVATFYKS